MKQGNGFLPVIVVVISGLEQINTSGPEGPEALTWSP